jgi:DHA3 family macrolide efflux protein-like MFS transporter
MMDSVAGIGILLGGLILGVWGGFRRKIHTTLMGMVLFGLSFAVLGITPAGMFWLALAMVLVLGLTIPLIDWPIVAILQGTVAPEMQGRVFTLLSSLVNLTSPFSLAIAGPVTDWLGLQMWYVTAGVLCGAIGAAGFFIPAIVNIEHNHNGHVAEDVSLPTAAVAVPVEVTE